MWFIWLIGLAPVAVALVVALGVRFVLMRRTPPLERRVVIATAAAGGAAVLVFIVVHAFGTWAPFPVGDGAQWQRARYVAPLVIGILLVGALMIPGHRPREAGVADVARRTTTSFLAWRWVVTVAVTAAVIVAISLAAGAASVPDEADRYLAFIVHIGTAAIGSGTYGWYFSVPALSVMIVLIAVTVVAWMLVPRPAWSDDVEHDRAVRRLRCANIGRAASGALLVHLSAVLGSLAGTALLSGGVNTTEAGFVFVHTPFAAIEPLLQWSSWIALIGGLACWILAALTAVPTTARHPVSAAS